MAENRLISRRRFLKSAGVAAGLAAVPLMRPKRARAATLRPVSMRLDWLFQGSNEGFIVARDKGFYEQVGLDVTVGPGKGSGSTAQLVATKDAQFGFADGFVVGNSVAKGMNIRMVAAVYRRNPTAVVVLDESDIKKPKDLEGKTIAMPTGSAQYQQWPAYAKGCGLDTGRIKVANIDPAGLPRVLMSGHVAAIAAFAQGFVPSVEIRGDKKTRILWYTDCGVTAVSNGIIVHTDLLKEDPRLIRDFVAASLKGFLYARQNPGEAAKIILKYLPAGDMAIVLRQMQLAWETWVTPATAGKPLGWMSDKDWVATVAVLKQYGGVTAALETRRLYTNEFVPTGTGFIPPQPAAVK